MKKSLSLFLIAAIPFLFASCGLGFLEDMLGGIMNNVKVAGTWYYVEDNTIYLLDVSAEGSAECEIMSYNDDVWSSEYLSYDYTLSDESNATIDTYDETYDITYKATTNLLKINHKGETYNFARYDDYSVIEEAKRSIDGSSDDNNYEDGGEDLTPGTGIVEKDEYSNESLKQRLMSSYIDIVDFAHNQLTLEKIRLTGTDYYGYDTEITPDLYTVSECWEAGYRALRNIEFIINKIGTIDDNDLDRQALYSEAVTMRSFLEYNIAELWGVVLYAAGEEHISIVTRDEMLRILKDRFMSTSFVSISNDEESKYRFSNNASKALFTEILLNFDTKFNFEGQVEFSLHIENGSYLSSYYGSEIPIYSPRKVSLLLKEIDEDTEKLNNDWKEFGFPNYGYWSMLKRKGIATQEAMCEGWELLMPIPMSELESNHNLKQNPGYY